MGNSVKTRSFVSNSQHVQNGSALNASNMDSRARTGAPPDPTQPQAIPFQSRSQATKVAERPRGRAYRLASAEHKLIADCIVADFDAAFYLTKYDDIAEAVARDPEFDPLMHYVGTGWLEGRDPSPLFSTSEYLEVNPDVKEAGLNPFYHYVIAGRKEERSIRLPGGYRARHLRSLRTLEEQAAAWRLPSIVATPRSPEMLRAYIAPALDAAAGRVVISLSHDNYQSNVGGVQRCIQIEADASRAAGFCYIHIYPAQPLPQLASADAWAELQLCVSVNGVSLEGCSASEFIDALQRLRRHVHRPVIAAHALHGHAPEMVSGIAETLSVREGYYWIHDFLAICSGYNLLRNGIAFCGPPPLHAPACRICVYGDTREVHHARMTKLFNTLNWRVVAPSESSAEIWRHAQIAPHLPVSVLPHANILRQPQRREELLLGRPLRIGFLGYPVFHKGWPVFESLLDRFWGDARYEFHHFSTNGTGDRRVAHWPVTVTREDPAAMVEAVRAAAIDYALIWSLCPETFCFTALEALAGGAAILTHRLSGNAASLASERGRGVVLEDEAALWTALETGELSYHQRRAVEHKGQIGFSRMTFDLIEGL